MTAPGWYPDPDDPNARRYYDGTNWSAPVRDSAPSIKAPRASWPVPTSIIAAVIGAVLLLVGLILGYGSIHSSGVDCGSAFGGPTNNGIAQDYGNVMEGGSPFAPSVDDACTAGLASRDTTAKALAWPGGVLVGLALFGLVIALTNPAAVEERRERSDSADPGTWSPPNPPL